MIKWNLRILGLFTAGGDGVEAHVAVEAGRCTGQSSTDPVWEESSLAVAKLAVLHKILNISFD